MLGISPKDSSTLALLALSGVAFLVAARWPLSLASSRAVMVCSLGFSLGFMLLALVSGLAVLH